MTVPQPVLTVSAYAPPAGGPPCDLLLDGRAGLAWPATPRPEAADAVYPDTAPLVRDLAAWWQVDPGHVAVGAGADDLLDRACRAFLGPGRHAVLTDPTFAMLPRYAARTGAAVRTVPWSSGALPLPALRAAAADACGLVAVVTPCNPTGLVAATAELLALADAAPDALLLVDLAYGEFADTDPTRELLARPSVLVVRTFSKAWGLAAWRVGYALGHPAVIAALQAAGSPYPTGAVGLALARERLRTGRGHLAVRVAHVRRERRQLTALLHRLGIAVPPSQANFVLVRDRRAAWLAQALASLGIAGRLLAPDTLRLGLPGDRDAGARLRAAVATALAPTAVGLQLADNAQAAAARAELGERISVVDGPPDPRRQRRRWLLTDRPAAAAAARAAGTVAIGLAGTPAAAATLTAAGCGRIIGAAGELLEVLP